MKKRYKSWAERCKDVRWQKCRDGVYNRANWTCLECGRKTELLSAHHLYYERNKDPWDYPNEAFLCVCEECHEKRYQAELRIDKTIHKLFTAEQLHQLAECFNGGSAHATLDALVYLQSRPELLSALAGINACHTGGADTTTHCSSAVQPTNQKEESRKMSHEEGAAYFRKMREVIDAEPPPPSMPIMSDAGRKLFEAMRAPVD